MKGKLVQGEYYDFRVIKKVALGDSSQFWVLEDPFGFRHMLDASYYKKYHIAPEIVLRCKVDKINCTGKIFLEPPHPFYSVGDVCSFPVIGISHIENCFIVTVEDKLGFRHTVSLKHNVGEAVDLRIARIKKGKLYLSDSRDTDECWFTEGNVYSFYVADIKDAEGCGVCFYLRDNADRIHLLPTKNYLHYGISADTHIRCNVIKQSADGQTTLEPLNPAYVPGKRYLFPYSDFHFKISYNGRKEYVLTVKDCWGHAIDVVTDVSSSDVFKKSGLIDCEVDVIKKGRLYLTDPQPVNTH